MLNIAVLFAEPRLSSRPRKMSRLVPRSASFPPAPPHRVQWGCRSPSTPGGTARALHIRPIWIDDRSDVCNSTSSSPSASHLFVLLFWQVIRGPLLIWHVRSTIKQRGLVNSLLQLGKLTAITHVFVTDLQIPASNLPSGWMLQSGEPGHAFPSNYLLPAIILRILWFSFILSRKNKAAAVIKRHIN